MRDREWFFRKIAPRLDGFPLSEIANATGLSLATFGITAEHHLHVYSDRNADAADTFGRLVG